MDDFAGYTLSAASPNSDEEADQERVSSFSRAGNSDVKKSVRITTSNVNNDRKVSAGNNPSRSGSPVQPDVENGLLSRMSTNSSNAILDFADSKPSSGTQLSDRKSSSRGSGRKFHAQSPAEEKNSLSNSNIESKAAERLNSKPPWDSTSNLKKVNVAPKESIPRARSKLNMNSSAVQPIGEHVLLRRMTANAQGTKPDAVSPTRTSNSSFSPTRRSTFSPPVFNYGQLNKFSVKGIAEAIKSAPNPAESSDDRASHNARARRVSLGQSTPVVGKKESPKRFSPKSIIKSTPGTVERTRSISSSTESSSTDQSFSVVIEAQDGLLKTFSAKRIDAAVTPTPSKSSSGNPLIAENRLLREISAKFVDAGVKSTPSTVERSHSRSYEDQQVPAIVEPPHGLLSPRATNAAARFTHSGIGIADDQSPHDQIASYGLQKFSTKSIDSGVEYTPGMVERSRISSSKDEPVQVVVQAPHGLLKKFSARAIDEAARYTPYKSDSTDDQIASNGLQKFSTKSINAGVKSTRGTVGRSSSSSSEAQPVPFLVEAPHGLLKKFSARAIDSAVRFTPSESDSADDKIADNGFQQKFSTKFIDAGVKPTPGAVERNRSRSESQPVPVVFDASHELLKTFPPRAIDPAVRFSSESGSANDQTPHDQNLDYGLQQKFSTKSINAGVKSTRGTVERSSRSSSEAQPVPFLVEAPHGLLKKFSARAIDSAVRFTPSESDSADDKIADNEFQQKFSTKFIDAGVKPTPGAVERSSSSSESQPAQFLVEAPHGLLKKFSARAIDSAVRFTPSESDSADDKIADTGFQQKFSTKFIDAGVKPTPGAVERSSSSSESQPVPVVFDASHELLKKFPPRAIDPAVRFAPSGSGSADGQIADNGLLHKTFTKLVEAGVKSTPSALERSSGSGSEDQPVPVVVEVPHGLPKKFSLKAIEAALGFTPSETRNVDDQIAENGVLKITSTKPIEAGVKSTPGTVGRSSISSSEEAGVKSTPDTVGRSSISSSEDQPVPVLEAGLLKKFSEIAIDAEVGFTPSENGSTDDEIADNGLLQKFSTESIDAGVKFTSTPGAVAKSSSISEDQSLPVELDGPHGLLEDFSTKDIDTAVKFTPLESSSADELVADNGLRKKFSAKSIEAGVTFTPSESSSADKLVADNGLRKKFSAKSIDAGVTFTPSKSSSADELVADNGLRNKFSAKSIDAGLKATPGAVERSSRRISFEDQRVPVGFEAPHELVKKFSATAMDAGVICTPSESGSADDQIADNGLLTKLDAKSIVAGVKSTPGAVERSRIRSSDDQPVPVVVEAKHGLLKKFSAKAIDAGVKFMPSASSSGDELVTDNGLRKKFSAKAIDAAVNIRDPASEDSSRPDDEPVVDHAFPKYLSARVIDAAAIKSSRSLEISANPNWSSSSSVQRVDEADYGLQKRFTPSSKEVDDVDLQEESESEMIDISAHPPRAKTLRPRSSTSVQDVKVAPPKLFGPRAKPGGVLDRDEPKVVRICVLGIRGRVLYLEVYKDFIDLLLNFLSMRTGAVIKLLREVDTSLEFGGRGGGILNVYDSVSKLNESMLTGDKNLLLNPIRKLNLTKELQSLASFEPECCNAECPKYMSSSRLVCKDCIISNHFSCSICNAYFRDNVHTTTCYAPCNTWCTNVSAAPVLNRYTVVQSMNAIVPPKSQNPGPRGGFVKHGVPFMITDDLNITPLTTSSIAKVLNTLDDEYGKTEELDCHELLVGKTEVVFLVGAAMTSLTPLTDVFAYMCKSENKISGSTSLSHELAKRASGIAKPLEDLMTYVRPLASGLADALQQGPQAAVKRLSELQRGPLMESETSNVAIHEDSPSAATKKRVHSSATLQDFNTRSDVSSPDATKEKSYRSDVSPTPASEKKSSKSTTPQNLIPEVPPPAARKNKPSLVATAQDSTSETMKDAEDNAPPLPAVGRNSWSVGKPRDSVSKTGQTELHLLLIPEGQTLEALQISSTPREIQRKQLQAAPGNNQPCGVLVTKPTRKSCTGIVQKKSIDLPHDESDEETNPTSKPRRGFLHKFFSSSVLKAPKDKEKNKKKKQTKRREESETDSTPSERDPPPVLLQLSLTRLQRKKK